MRSTKTSLPPVGDKRRVRQAPKRASYDHQDLCNVLDACLVGHVSFVHQGLPQSIPTAIARLGDYLYLHGSRSSRMFNVLVAGDPVCISVCRVDALVKARCAFSCSMNYRSAVIFARGEVVSDDEKAALLDQLTERLIPGSQNDFRPHLAKELKATELVRIALNDASVKIRSGDPIDDEQDLELPFWAGVIPITKTYGPPMSSANLSRDITVPNELLRGLVP